MNNLVEIFRALDQWVARENIRARAEGTPAYRSCSIRVLGQSALWAAGVDLTLTATQDLDARADYEWAVQRELERLLAENGKVLDPHGHEVWMPRETRYNPLYQGTFVEALVADADAVLISKALKAAEKNRALVTEYLAKGASERFFELARKYRVDLEQFV
jgi:hypothetical protein